MNTIIDRAAFAASGGYGYEPYLVDDPEAVKRLSPTELSGDDWRNVVRAVLREIREPSEAMLDAGGDRDTLGWDPAPGQVWQAMIDAALAETAPEQA